jgi:hypothetical protein
MTDEPREETQDEEQDVESHGPIGEKREKHERDEGDDVEAHSPPIGLPPIGEPPIG